MRGCDTCVVGGGVISTGDETSRPPHVVGDVGGAICAPPAVMGHATETGDVTDPTILG
jgi:hypothetical protein